MDSTSPTLLEQLRGPDRAAAWGRFVSLYTPLLARWADRARVPAADRPDLIQDVYVAVLRAVPGFAYDPGRSFRAWLHTVLTNKVHDLRRKKVPAPLPDGSGFPVAADDPVPALDEAEYRRVLAARAARLMAADFAPATWKAFWGTAVDGRPAAEVGAEVGLSVNTVYLARARVLARLRHELAGLWE